MHASGVLIILTIALIAQSSLAAKVASLKTNIATSGIVASSEASPPDVCFVVRTYWGHGPKGNGRLTNLLERLQDQTYTKWVALLLVLDSKPFQELRSIVSSINDPRISVYAEWVGMMHQPKNSDGSWVRGYHKTLYMLTDDVIRGCPNSTRWVVITNGDNDYDRTFLSYVKAAPEDTDVVVFDFYSRYQRPTATPCERFATLPGLPAPNCKENAMRYCQTDLSAMVLNWPRLLEEDRRFGPLDPTGSYFSNDGMMAQVLLTFDWQVHRVSGRRCLVSHYPNPQTCALEGGVWDETRIANRGAGHGGECVSVAEALERLEEAPEVLEDIFLNITFDSRSFTFRGLKNLTLQCIRYSDRNMWDHALDFGRPCAARMDEFNLPVHLPPNPWDEWVAAAPRLHLERLI